MQNEDPSPDLADDNIDMPTEGAVNPSTELRKRRSTRIVQAVPLVVTGVDALGRPFAERTSTLIINCHGCRYQSKHYVLKNMWVNLEVPHSEQGHGPRRVRGKVAWIQRPRTVRQLFQVALELENPGNTWGIAFPPDDWFAFPDEASGTTGAVLASELPPSVGTTSPPEAPLPIVEAEPGVATPDNLRVFPAPTSATDASLQLARQVARLLAEAKQQIHAAAREAAVQAVAAERRLAFEQWEEKFTAFREEVARETTHAIGHIQEETQANARTAQAAAAESLRNELPRWLAPQLEQLTHELTAHLAREGAAQRDQHEKQLASAHETLQTLCGQAEEAAAKLRTQAELVESQVTSRLQSAANEVEEEARQRELAAGAQKELLNAAVNEIHARSGEVLNEAQTALHETITRATTEAQERAAAALREHTQVLREELKTEGAQQNTLVRETLEAHEKQLEDALARVNLATERLEQHAGRIETSQHQAIAGFQSQLDDVLTFHRNELHRQSDNLFEQIHARIRASFEAANSEALEKFDQQVQSMVQPHITRTEEAVHRLAGGRSLLDAAMTMQQDRIRASADEAFAESLARFRENLGSVEQVLNESAQSITGRNLEDLENKAVDLKHHTMEEMFKSAEWYEKKAQTQLQNLAEKLVEQTGNQLREKAGEISSLFAGELNHASRSYLTQSQKQLEETVREAFERVRLLFAEAADTTSAAFIDEIQRNARQELDGFLELMQKSVEESRERLDTAREQINQKVTSEQEEFLHRFHGSMSDALDRSLMDAQKKVQSSFNILLDSWKSLSEVKQSEMRGSFVTLGNEAVEQYRGRLENISNSWMVATVATLDHQSRDVIAKIAATAEEQLRAASSEVFANFGDTLREKLQQIAASFERPPQPPSP
jgi:hypothetical protein